MVAQMPNAPRFHRSGQASQFGKRTAAVKTLVAEETKEALRALWRSLDYQTESEFLAHLIEVRVHGLDHVSSLTLNRLQQVAGIGPKKD